MTFVAAVAVRLQEGDWKLLKSILSNVLEAKGAKSWQSILGPPGALGTRG